MVLILKNNFFRSKINHCLLFSLKKNNLYSIVFLFYITFNHIEKGITSDIKNAIGELITLFIYV